MHVVLTLYILGYENARMPIIPCVATISYIDIMMFISLSCARESREIQRVNWNVVCWRNREFQFSCQECWLALASLRSPVYQFHSRDVFLWVLVLPSGKKCLDLCSFNWCSFLIAITTWMKIDIVSIYDGFVINGSPLNIF